MSFSQKKLINMIYNPPRGKGGPVLEGYVSDRFGVKLYPFARNALLQALKEIDVKSGDVVLVPAFICRDVLAPFNHLGAKIVFYEIDRKLNPKSLPNINKLAKVVLGVHYFGIECDLSLLKEYCENTGASLIIDNAHGFLSRNQNGQLLGTEGRWGIVSVRKTLPIPNGALLISANEKGVNKSEVGFVPFAVNLKLKKFLRPMAGFLPISILNFFVNIKRIMSGIILGNQMPISSEKNEIELPSGSRAYNIESYLSTIDVKAEICRRRESYNLLKVLLEQQPIDTFRESLNPHEVPYVFPFICSPEKIIKVKNYLKKFNLEVVQWPTLPNKVKEDMRCDFYEQVYMVMFLW